MINHDEIIVAGMPLQFPKPLAGSQLPTLAEWNQKYIEYVLGFTKGKKTAAARILGINRRTLYRRKKVQSSEILVGSMNSTQNPSIANSKLSSEKLANSETTPSRIPMISPPSTQHQVQ